MQHRGDAVYDIVLGAVAIPAGMLGYKLLCSDIEVACGNSGDAFSGTRTRLG